MKGMGHFLRGQEKESAYVGVGNLIAGAIGGIFWLLMAMLVQVNVYGQLHYLISLSTILSILSLVGLNLTIMATLSKGEENLRQQANLFVLITNAGLVIPMLLLIRDLPFSLLLVGTSFFSMSIAEMLGRKNYRRFMFHVIGQRVLQFGLSFALYFVIGIDGVLVGYGISLLAFSHRYLVEIVRSGRVARSRIRNVANASEGYTARNVLLFDALRARARFVIHSYLTGISQSVALYADKLLIAPAFGYNLLGNYQLGFQFLVFLSVIPVSLTQYLLPQESSGIERKGVRKAGIILAAMMGILFFFMMEYIISIFFHQYTAAIPAARIMILGIVPMSVNAVINSRLLGTGNSKSVVIASGTYLVVLFSLMFVLGTYLQLMGLAMALVVSLTVQSILLLILQRYARVGSELISRGQ